MGEGRPRGGDALAVLPGLTHYNLAVFRSSPLSPSTFGRTAGAGLSTMRLSAGDSLW